MADAPDTNSYLYNARSELTNATATVDATYRYGYNFDDIGNRKSSAERGVWSSEYTANNLNQYITITSQTARASEAFRNYYDVDGNQIRVKTARDPIEDVDGDDEFICGYCYVANSVVEQYDRLGLKGNSLKPGLGSYTITGGGKGGKGHGGLGKGGGVKCCKGKRTQLVPIWHCTRKLGGSGPTSIPFFNHQYLCCDGSNSKCFGVQKYLPSCEKKCRSELIVRSGRILPCLQMQSRRCLMWSNLPFGVVCLAGLFVFGGCIKSHTVIYQYSVITRGRVGKREKGGRRAD